MAIINPTLGPNHVPGGTWTIRPDDGINASTGAIDTDDLDAGSGSGTTYNVTYTSPGGVEHVDPFLYCAQEDSTFTYPASIDDEQTSVLPDSITTSGGLFDINGKAVETLTLTGLPLDTETVTIGVTVYTFLDTFVDAGTNVHIGADADECIDNLISAITGVATGSAVEGTDFPTGVTVHPDVTALQGDGDTMYTVAKVAGAAGNSIATTETLTNGSWGAATMSGGVTGAINTISGEIAPDNLGVGTWEVTYRVTSAAPCNTCSSVTSVDVRVKDQDSADFSIADQCIL